MEVLQILSQIDFAPVFKFLSELFNVQIPAIDVSGILNFVMDIITKVGA